MVLLADGSSKRVDEVVKGDAVGAPLSDSFVNPGGYEVQCVVRSKCRDGRATFCSLNDGKLVLTMWHPVYLDRSTDHEEGWYFPVDRSKDNLIKEDCKFVYNFLLAQGHIATVGGLLSLCSLTLALSLSLSLSLSLALFLPSWQ